MITDRVSITCTPGAPYNASFSDPETRGWTVHLGYDGRQLTVPFYQGSAHTEPPTVKDVLSCLLLDASGYVNARDFDDWASEYGYDIEESQDRQRARSIYNTVKRYTEKLERFLGSDYQQFEEALQDY